MADQDSEHSRRKVPRRPKQELEPLEFSDIEEILRKDKTLTLEQEQRAKHVELLLRTAKEPISDVLKKLVDARPEVLLFGEAHDWKGDADLYPSTVKPKSQKDYRTHIKDPLDRRDLAKLHYPRLLSDIHRWDPSYKLVFLEIDAGLQSAIDAYLKSDRSAASYDRIIRGTPDPSFHLQAFATKPLLDRAAELSIQVRAVDYSGERNAQTELEAVGRRPVAAELSRIDADRSRKMGENISRDLQRFGGRGILFVGKGHLMSIDGTNDSVQENLKSGIKCAVINLVGTTLDEFEWSSNTAVAADPSLLAFRGKRGNFALVPSPVTPFARYPFNRVQIPASRTLNFTDPPVIERLTLQKHVTETAPQALWSDFDAVFVLPHTPRERQPGATGRRARFILVPKGK